MHFWEHVRKGLYTVWNSSSKNVNQLDRNNYKFSILICNYVTIKRTYSLLCSYSLYDIWLWSEGKYYSYFKDNWMPQIMEKIIIGLAFNVWDHKTFGKCISNDLWLWESTHWWAHDAMRRSGWCMGDGCALWTDLRLYLPELDTGVMTSEAPHCHKQSNIVQGM